LADFPLFHIVRKSSNQHYIALDFVKGRETYLLLCKPLPEKGTGANGELIEDDIRRQAEDSSVQEEVLTANECEFSLFSQFLNYSIISRKMMNRGITCKDLSQINFPQEHLDLIKGFMEPKRNT
jgi:hypothetical protein